MTEPTQNYGFQELRRAARAKQRLLEHLRELETVATSTAGPAVAASLAARRMVRSAPILSVAAVCVVGYLTGRRTSRHRSYEPLLTKPPQTAHLYQSSPIWAGLAGAGLQLLVDRLTGLVHMDRFEPHE